MIQKNDPANQAGEKSFLRGLGFCGVGMDSNSVVVDVKQGKVVRIRPLHYDWKYQPEELNPWKMEVRGKVFEPTMKSLIPPISLSYKKRIYSPNRILHPMKRVDWDPKKGRHPETRGQSKFVCISWDEALDLIVSEINRVKQTYGMTSVLLQADGHGETKVLHGPHSCQRRLLNLLGGYTQQTRNPDSWEGWYWGAKHVWGMEPVGQLTPMTNSIPDIAQNTELLLFWGCDPETTTWGWQGQFPSRLCQWFKELGIRSIYICPDLNYGAAIHADKWIPIRPNTDAALQLAIAYIWITGGLYNNEYVATHTYGFEKFADYVTGKEDGVPKTPNWAAEKTGVSSRIIKALAKEWASRRTSIAHGNGGSMIRGPYSTEPARLEALLLAMRGLGKPGVNQLRTWGVLEHGRDGEYPFPESTVTPDVTVASQGQRRPVTRSMREGRVSEDVAPPPQPARQIIIKTLVPDAILNPPISWYGTGMSNEPTANQFRKYSYPAEGCSEIHMIWTDSPCWITCWNNSNRIIEAFRNSKIEFILAQHPWMENDCLYADIILPVNTKFEVNDISVDGFSGQFRTVMYEDRCIQPLGESRSDYEIVCLLAERFGLLKEYTLGRNQEEWIKLGFDSSGVARMISFDDFKQKGYFVVPTDPNWKKGQPFICDFNENPQKYPLKTPSGKIEFCSQDLAKNFPDDQERPPVPHWIEKSESHDETLSSRRAKIYPLLVVSNHGRWRVHAQHDDISWTREIITCKVKGADGYLYEPIWIHPSDAAKRGIQDGDIIKIFNERGVVLGGARVWERIMPGVVYMDHGARYDPIVHGELDRGGAINTITPGKVTSKNVAGMATSGFLVEVAPVNIDELRQKYSEAFQRPYDPAAGLPLKRAVDKGHP